MMLSLSLSSLAQFQDESSGRGYTGVYAESIERNCPTEVEIGRRIAVVGGGKYSGCSAHCHKIRCF